jgi:putative phage-type endonuclease
MTATATVPAGVLLGRFAPGTPGWDAARAGLTITATEAPAVVGLSPFQSRFTLWHKKSGRPFAPFIDAPAIEWGRRLEPSVAAKFADEHPEYLVEETGTWRHRDREWQRATPDRVLWTADSTRTALLEVKTSPIGEEWGEPGTDEVPIYYRAQVLWQLDTLGLDLCHVAVLISGWDYREYTVRYDPAEAAILRDAAQRFLEDVRHGERPDIDGSESTYQTARAQKPGVERVSVDIGPRLADRYRDALENAKALEVERRQVAALILDRLGPATRAEALGELIAVRATKADGSTHALMPARTGKKAN